MALAGLLTVGALCGPLVAQDSPAEGREFWVLEFKFETLRMFSPDSGAYKGGVYWYMLYTIENKTEEDLDVYVAISATTNKKKVYTDAFLPGVERGVERKLRARRWGQADRFEILKDRDPSDERYHYTTIKAGEKRDCIAIFDKFEATASSISIEVRGLSNDIRQVTKDDGTVFLEERVRRLEFKRVGDEYEIDQDGFKTVLSEWTKKSVERN